MASEPHRVCKPQTEVVDRELRRWRVKTIVVREELGSGWQRFWRHLRDQRLFRCELTWEQHGSMSFDELKQAVLRSPGYPFDWIDEEFVAGEDNPPHDDEALVRYCKDRVAAAATVEQLYRVLDHPYEGATAFADYVRMFPEASYPVIGILPSGMLKAYRNEALCYWRGRREDAPQLKGMRATDSEYRQWRIEAVAIGGHGGPRKNPVYGIETDIVAAGKTDLHALIRMVGEDRTPSRPLGRRGGRTRSTECGGTGSRHQRLDRAARFAR